MEKLFLVVISFLSTICVVFAQEVVKPNLNVGDWCKYESSRYSQLTHRVTEILPDGGFVLKIESELFNSIRIYNEKHQLVDSDGYKFLPMWSGKEYPIKAGENSGGGKFSYEHRTKPGVKVEADVKIDSVYFEKISVPAGEFNALAVVTIMNYRLSTGFGSRTVQTVWYPIRDNNKKFPEWARFLKSEFFDYGSNVSGEIVKLISCGRKDSVTSPSKQ